MEEEEVAFGNVAGVVDDDEGRLRFWREVKVAEKHQ